MDKYHKLGLIALASTVLFAGTSPAFSEEPAAKPVAPQCTVNLVDPTKSGDDCEKVIDVVRNITRALADHDFTAMAVYMDENCSCYNEHTGKLVSGRDNIITEVKHNTAAEEKRLKIPPIGFTIDHPYAKVNGDTATVNFVLIKEIGGDHPAKYKSHCTDVLIKQNGQWKKLMFRGDDWKQEK